MADWWDADGRRHRKQFANSAAAREHEHRETALAHAERASREMKLAARTGGVKRSSPKVVNGTTEPAKGKLGVMIPGMGAVATTFVAGVEAIRKGLAKPIGSLTQMGTVRLGKRTDGRSPKVKEFVPLAGLDDLVFTGWDIFEDNMYDAASNAGVLDQRLLDQLKPFLSSVTPRPAVFDHNYVKKIDGPNVKKGKSKMDLAEQLRDDIREFRKSSGASRLITMWCGSTCLACCSRPYGVDSCLMARDSNSIFHLERRFDAPTFPGLGDATPRRFDGSTIRPAGDSVVGR